MHRGATCTIVKKNALGSEAKCSVYAAFLYVNAALQAHVFARLTGAPCCRFVVNACMHVLANAQVASCLRSFGHATKLDMQVRAARLSGDCSMSMEAQRGIWPTPGYEKACVKRRAQLSVAMLPHCKLTAPAHVLSCLEECYQDTEPFSRPP